MTNLEELLAGAEMLTQQIVSASKQENIAQMTDLLVELASTNASINVAVFKAQTTEKRAKAEVDDMIAETRYQDLEEGGSGIHADAKSAAHSIPAKKAHRIADEHYRRVKTYRDNYQTIIEVLRSRVSALKTEQKNL